MANDWHLIQIRIGQRLRNRIRTLSEKHENSNADIVRGALELGVQIMEKLLEAQDIMAKEYLRLLKVQSRKRNAKNNQTKETTSIDLMETKVSKLDDL
jgi:predicted DNA-binding protein